MGATWKITLLFLLIVIALSCVTGKPCPPAGCSAPPTRHRRDVMESMKQAWNDMVTGVKNTGDKIMYTFNPTTSRIDGLIDTISQSG